MKYKVAAKYQRNYMYTQLIYLLSHKAPVQSPLQEQTVLLFDTLHVPSLLQGLPPQGLTVNN